MRVNKWLYLWILQGDYGHGWEDITAETTLGEIVMRKWEYDINEGGTYRVVMRREPNPAWNVPPVTP